MCTFYVHTCQGPCGSSSCPSLAEQQWHKFSFIQRQNLLSHGLDCIFWTQQHIPGTCCLYVSAGHAESRGWKQGPELKVTTTMWPFCISWWGVVAHEQPESERVFCFLKRHATVMMEKRKRRKRNYLLYLSIAQDCNPYKLYSDVINQGVEKFPLILIQSIH